MNTDTALTIGLLIGVFSIPAMLSAYSEDRAPRYSMAAFILAAATIAWAVTQKPGGYELADVPNVVIEVIARMIR
ncbi:hypothetical protein SAMN04490248_11167 [Salinihabitans flavidus]|uniref:50S ribosomal protein L35 n=1 Tax=Salinihabitans flavidus TaxID=569882 RepID=A0A1H8S9L7_9RHOB|nr:hypothetical protein [Salinihabitans flavidus]SEO75420.1 hypothetical protein SAMN04490248_11167 [Salinihabitans flavidus]